MGMERTETERTRAWVLVEAKEDRAPDVAHRILALNEILKERYPRQDNIVIRADVVAGPHDLRYNIIVPVDVANQEVLERLIGLIRDLIGDEPSVGNTVTALVEAHNPYPPHSALGYITEAEYELDPEEIEKPGLQGASPGENPWG